LFWGCSHSFASVGTLFENLIQLVNIVGSIFGTVLGIFLFSLNQIRQSQNLYSALVSQITIFFIYYYAILFSPAKLAGLFMANFIGAMLTIVLSAILQLSVFRKEKDNIS
jgi:hypothetical protein